MDNISTHDWVNDESEQAGGVLKCRREGCSLRRATIGGVWQRKKGAHWRSEAREMMPACGPAMMRTPAESSSS